MTEEAKIPSEKKFNQLIKEIAKGSKEALESLYMDYGRLMHSIAGSVTKSSYFVDEIVDDVLVKIWQAAPTLQSIKKPVSWICTVTANCAKDKLKAEKQYSEIYDIPQEDKNIDAFIVKDAFLSHISSLNDEEQLIIILYYIQGLSFKLIAKELKKPLSTVTSIYYRAKKKLKQTLKTF